MKDEILKLLEDEYDHYVQSTNIYAASETITKMVNDFIEWCCTTHIKLHKVWCGLYQDQRNEKNRKTTEELFIYWNTNIRTK
jgi:hypothetical protein